MNKHFILIILFIVLVFFPLMIQAQNSCDKMNVDNLKEKFSELQKIRSNAERGIIESDKIIMSAQEIILLARAKGNIEAIQVAEEALKKAEKAKEGHRKNKKEAEKEIEILRQYIEIAERNYLKNLNEVCNKFMEQVEQDKAVLKRFLKDAEELSKRQAQREREIFEVYGEMIFDFVSSLLPFMQDCKTINEQIGKTIEKLASSTAINDPKTKELVWKIWKNVHNISLMLEKEMPKLAKLSENIDMISKATQVGKFDAEALAQSLAYIRITYEKNEHLNKDLEDLKADLKVLATSADTYQLLFDLGLSCVDLESSGSSCHFGLSFLEKLVQKHRNLLKKAIPWISALNTITTATYHTVRITILEEEVNRDYKLTDDLFKTYNKLKEQLERSMENVKKCEDYCKKFKR